MIWGKPSDYIYLLKFTPGECSYKRRLLQWLEWENPDLLEMVKKELAREGQSIAKANKGTKQKAPSSRVTAQGESDDPLPELGDDLLAGGA